MTDTDFGHVPMTAAPSKALGAGGGIRKDAPSPFQTALEHPALSYQHWWILTKLRVRTTATAAKLKDAEFAKLKAGLKTNSYGDRVSLAYGFETSARYVQKYGLTVTHMHGFRKWKKRYSPIKSTHYVTSHTLDALHAVLQLATQIEKDREAERTARQGGFVSVAALRRWQKRWDLGLSNARSQGRSECWQQAALDIADLKERHTTELERLKRYHQYSPQGIGPLDIIDGPRLTLVYEPEPAQRRTVSLVDFLNIHRMFPDSNPDRGAKRAKGWELPVWVEPPELPPLLPNIRNLPTTTHAHTA